MDPLSWSILFVVVGCLFLLLEVLVPSGGVLGGLSAASFIAAVAFAFRSGGTNTGFAFMALVMLLVPTLLVVAFKYLPYTPLGRVLMAQAPTEEEVAPHDPRREFIGQLGVARSKMLPSGVIEIEGQIIDAVSKGQAVDPGQTVRVVEVHGNHVTVRLAANETPPSPSPSSPQPPTVQEKMTQSLEELGIEPLDDPLS